MNGPGLLEQLTTENSAVADASAVVGPVTCHPAPCTQRPTKISSLAAVPSPLMNCTQMNGFPPTPPSTGCFGMTISAPAGTSVSCTVLSTESRCVPFTLLLNCI